MIVDGSEVAVGLRAVGSTTPATATKSRNANEETETKKRAETKKGDSTMLAWTNQGAVVSYMRPVPPSTLPPSCSAHTRRPKEETEYITLWLVICTLPTWLAADLVLTKINERNQG